MTSKKPENEKKSSAVKEKNYHIGHRKRMKERFLCNGEAAFDDHELLELLLFYAIPQGDTNLLAHRLMDYFGNLASIFDASVPTLMEVPGIGQHAALLICMIPQIARRYHIDRSQPKQVLRDAMDYAEWFRPYFFGSRNEKAYMLSLNAKGKVLGCDLIDEGDILSCSLFTRRVAEIAFRHRATAVVLAHCHVVGSIAPSPQDHQTTLSCRKILDKLDIALVDHLIFCDGNYLSMAQQGSLYRHCR